MQFEELNFDELEEALKSLKRNKAAGFDDLTSNIIIDAYDSLKNILFHVFKVSIQQGIFPASLKIAKVTPIFKSGDKGNVSNYCPISILPVSLKVLERIMYNRVFIDLSKTFNTVDHQILIKKLWYYGIDGCELEWFKSYLSNR